jgi:phage-related minor tail protein
MSREDWVKIRMRNEELEREKRELEIINDRLRLDRENFTSPEATKIMKAKIEELEAWKQKAIRSRKKFYESLRYWEAIRPE